MLSFTHRINERQHTEGNGEQKMERNGLMAVAALAILGAAGMGTAGMGAVKAGGGLSFSGGSTIGHSSAKHNGIENGIKAKRAIERAVRSDRGNGGGWGYPPRTGWTNARFRRASNKKRNQARNRRAHRGA